MNKARRKNNKRSAAKGLVKESLILSSTAFVSSRAVRFFQNGLASPLLRSVELVDSFAREKITGPLFKRTELRKNLIKPVKNAVAGFFDRNPIIKRVRDLQTAVLHSSMRSLGVFMLIFGIYSAAIFLFKRYGNIAGYSANPDELIVSAITAILGLIVSMFGDKSILLSLGNGKIIGSLLSGVLGVNRTALDSVPKKARRSNFGVSFLLGSLFGVLTMFVSPLKMLFMFGIIAVVAAIINIPEFGILFTVSGFLLLPVEWVALFALVSIISYLLHCLRSKSNFRFGTADAVMLLLFFASLGYCFASGDVSDGEFYLLTFMALYFAVKNLISTEALVKQTFNALCTGVFVGMAVYLIKAFAPLVPISSISSLLSLVSANAPSVDILAPLVAVVMPFALSSFSSYGTERKDVLFILLALCCAVASDSVVFYALLAAALFVFIANAYKAPVGSLLSAAVTLPPIFAVLLNVVNSKAILPLANKYFDPALSLTQTANSFWAGFSAVGGIISVLLLGVAALLILQRVCAATVITKSLKNTLMCGTVAAGTAMLLVDITCFNLLEDLRSTVIVWFVFGLGGAVYKVYYYDKMGE